MGKKPNKAARKHALAARPYEALLRRLAESLPGAALITDPEGVPLCANVHFRARFGSKPPGIWLDLVEGSDRAAARSLWLEAALEQAPSECELDLQTVAGRMRLVCRIAAIEDGGALLGWFATFSDLVTAETPELQDLRVRFTETQAKLKGVQALLETSEIERSTAVTRLRETQRILEDQNTRYSEAEFRERDAQALVEHSEAQRREAERRVGELEVLLEYNIACLATREARLQDLHLHLERSQVQSAEAQASIARKETERLEAVNRLHELQAQLPASDARWAEAQTQRGEAQARLESSEMRLARTAARLREFDELLQNSDARLAKVEAQRQEAQAAAERSEAARREALDRLRELEGHLERSRTRTKETEARLHEALALLESGEAQAAHIRDLDDLLRKGNARCAQAEAERREAQVLLERSDAQRLEALARLHELGEFLENSNVLLREAEAQRTAAMGQLREAENSRDMLEQAFRAKFEAVPQMLWTASPLGTVELYSKAWRDFTGADSAEDWLTPVHPDDQARVRHTWNEALAQGKAFAVEHLFRRRDGSYHPVQTRAQPVWDDGEALRGWMGSCADLQQVVSAQRTLAAVKAQLDRARAERNPPQAFAKERALAARARLEEEQKRAETNPSDKVTPRELRTPDKSGGPPTGVPSSDDPELNSAGTLTPDGSDTPWTPHLSLGPSEAKAMALPREEPDFDPLLGRLRSKALRDALDRWRAARGSLSVPRFDRWEGAASEVVGYMTIQLDDAGAPVRVLEARPLADSPLIRALSTPPGREGHGWQRCAATGRPAHDYAHVKLGLQESHSCERLLLPFSTNGGRVDRLVLLIVTEEA